MEVQSDMERRPAERNAAKELQPQMSGENNHVRMVLPLPLLPTRVWSWREAACTQAQEHLNHHPYPIPNAGWPSGVRGAFNKQTSRQTCICRQACRQTDERTDGQSYTGTYVFTCIHAYMLACLRDMLV